MLERLKKIDLRKAWKSEDQEFTPWLANEENLELLGDTIGIELELVAQEEDFYKEYLDKAFSLKIVENIDSAIFQSSAVLYRTNDKQVFDQLSKSFPGWKISHPNSINISYNIKNKELSLTLLLPKNE